LHCRCKLRSEPLLSKILPALAGKGYWLARCSARDNFFHWTGQEWQFKSLGLMHLMKRDEKRWQLYTGRRGGAPKSQRHLGLRWSTLLASLRLGKGLPSQSWEVDVASTDSRRLGHIKEHYRSALRCYAPEPEPSAFCCPLKRSRNMTLISSRLLPFVSGTDMAQ